MEKGRGRGRGCSLAARDKRSLNYRSTPRSTTPRIDEWRGDRALLTLNNWNELRGGFFIPGKNKKKIVRNDKWGVS